jgi:hypothetical protein
MRYIKLFEEFIYQLDPLELNEILRGYIDAAIWTEEESLNSEYAEEFDKVFDPNNNDESDNDEMENLIRKNFNNKSIEKFSKEDIEPDSLIRAYKDIKEFVNLAGEEAIDAAVSEYGYENLGHDLWLSRNGHGAGFFDRRFDDDIEKSLMDSARKMGEIYMYINGDMKLSFSNEYKD